MSPAGDGADNPEQQEATNYRQMFESTSHERGLASCALHGANKASR